MNILRSYQWLSSCTGIELHILPDNTLQCFMCSVSMAKDSLSIDTKSEVSGDLETILKKIPKDKPLALSVTGKGTLIKKAARMEAIGEQQLNEVFPNLKAEQFYVQNFVSGEHSFVSIIRKGMIDEFLDALNAAGHQVLIISIGPFVSSHIIRQLNTYGQQVSFNGHVVDYNQDWAWTDYQYVTGAESEFPLKLDIEPIEGRFLIAYATAFQLALYRRLDPVNLDVSPVENQLRDYQQKARFMFRGGIILIAFFVLLLINFIMFSFYTEKNKELLSRANQNTAGIENLQHMERQISTNENLLKELGWSRGISYAWMADQLGQSLPAALSLNEISINPLNTVETNRQRKEIYDTGKITIRGETTDLQAVNDWIYILKEKSWVKQVSLGNYSPVQDTDKQQFIITLTY